MLGVFALLYAVWVVLDLPPEQTIIETAKPYLDRYGAALVLACAYVEGLLLIGWYFPAPWWSSSPSWRPGRMRRVSPSSPPRPASACSPPT